LRASIHYRSWGQKDPLIEYKQEAYTMFVDLMHDVANTFTERFLKAQLVFDAPAAPPQERYVPPALRQPALDGGDGDGRPGNGRPTKRYNAMGILEDVIEDDEVVDAVLTAPAEQPSEPGAIEVTHSRPVAQGSPKVVGAGSVKSLQAGGGQMPAGWENTPRNNPCPCGSGKKFKKCHGASFA
jgi:preprotein translocase subunit SecA